MEWIQSTGKILHGSTCLWLVMNKSSVSCTQRSTCSQILYCALERWTRTHNQNLHGKTSWRVSKFIRIQSFGHNCWWANGIRLEHLPRDSPHCSLSVTSKSSCLKLSVQPEDFTGRIIFMSMFNDISRRSKDNEQECELSAQLVSTHARRFSPGKWSFLGPGSEKKWYSTRIQTTRRIGQSCWTNDDKMCRKRTPSFPCHGKIVNTFLRWPGNDWNCFSHNYCC